MYSELGSLFFLRYTSKNSSRFVLHCRHRRKQPPSSKVLTSYSMCSTPSLGLHVATECEVGTTGTWNSMHALPQCSFLSRRETTAMILYYYEPCSLELSIRCWCIMWRCAFIWWDALSLCFDTGVYEHCLECMCCTGSFDDYESSSDGSLTLLYEIGIRDMVDVLSV
jgi:hypothetical protein